MKKAKQQHTNNRNTNKAKAANENNETKTKIQGRTQQNKCVKNEGTFILLSSSSHKKIIIDRYKQRIYILYDNIMNTYPLYFYAQFLDVLGIWNQCKKRKTMEHKMNETHYVF
jgi:hypothetical protein